MDAAVALAISKRMPLVIANTAREMADAPPSSTGGGGTRKGWITDPTATNATNPHHDHASATRGRLHEIDRLLRVLLAEKLSLTAKYNYTPTTTHGAGTPTPADTDWCTSCLRIHMFAPRSRNDLCDWCYRFVLATGTPPALALLHARRDGRRINQQMVDAATQPTKVQRAKARSAG
jgi:hypothetical protein